MQATLVDPVLERGGLLHRRCARPAGLLTLCAEHADIRWTPIDRQRVHVAEDTWRSRIPKVLWRCASCLWYDRRAECLNAEARRRGSKSTCGSALTLLLHKSGGNRAGHLSSGSALAFPLNVSNRHGSLHLTSCCNSLLSEEGLVAVVGARLPHV